MTAAVIALALVLAGALGLVGFLVYRGEKRADVERSDLASIATMREQLMQKTLEAERTKFDLGNANTALATERTRAKALEDYVASQAATTDPNADLAPDDWAGRVLRLSRQLGATAAEAHPGSSVRPGPEPGVPAKPAAEAVPGAGPDDLLRPE